VIAGLDLTAPRGLAHNATVYTDRRARRPAAELDDRAYDELLHALDTLLGRAARGLGDTRRVERDLAVNERLVELLELLVRPPDVHVQVGVRHQTIRLGELLERGLVLTRAKELGGLLPQLARAGRVLSRHGRGGVRAEREPRGQGGGHDAVLRRGRRRFHARTFAQRGARAQGER
jgi:hypothetical protein